jgi:alpha-N-arabinofuranosidase
MMLDGEQIVGDVNHRLFGSFVEHVGRCVYGGLFAPGDDAASEEGFREDVVQLARELGVRVVRYPGGNFVSGYAWEDGVGPRDERPVRLDLAWRSTETNAFGLGEFMSWIGAVGAEPMLAVNLGTRDAGAAARLVEYANHPGGTRLSDMRRRDGHRDPFNVKLWCLGNEMDGAWQLGHTTAEDYARRASEAAQLMQIVDPSIELVVCGSSGPAMPSFGQWEEAVLERTYEQVDYLALHVYFEEVEGDLGSFLATGVEFESFILKGLAILDDARSRLRSRRILRLAVDEWNVWYQSREPARPPAQWPLAPRLLEDEYNLADAVAVGSYLITLLRHTDRIGIACQAQLVNAIAPIRAEPGAPAWRQTIFYPFSDTARLARGRVLGARPECSTYLTRRYGEVPVIDAVATHDPSSGEIVIFAVNRRLDHSTSLTLELDGLGPRRISEHRVLSSPDVRVCNDRESPERLCPTVRRPSGRVGERELRVELPPVSWSTIVLTREAQ